MNQTGEPTALPSRTPSKGGGKPPTLQLAGARTGGWHAYPDGRPSTLFGFGNRATFKQKEYDSVWVSRNSLVLKFLLTGICRRGGCLRRNGDSYLYCAHTFDILRRRQLKEFARNTTVQKQHILWCVSRVHLTFISPSPPLRIEPATFSISGPPVPPLGAVVCLFSSLSVANSSSLPRNPGTLVQEQRIVWYTPLLV